MHDTARCLGYPSDSTRAARERAREAPCGLPPARVWPGAVGSGHNLSGYCIRALASAAQLLARVARLFTIDALILARDARPVTYCARVAQLLARVARSSLTPGRRRAVPTSHWPWVSSRAARRRTATGWIADSAVYPLSRGRRRAVPTSHWPWVSSPAACRRAGSLARIATVVYIGVQWGGLGLALPEADRRQHRVPRGPGDRWSRPSLVREKLGRHRDRMADRQRRAAAPVSGSPDRARPVSRPGTTVDALSSKLASSPSRPHWGPVMHDPCSCRQSRWARRGRATNQPASGLLTTQPASCLLTTQPASIWEFPPKRYPKISSLILRYPKISLNSNKSKDIFYGYERISLTV
jgi:hypothetical protein